MNTIKVYVKQNGVYEPVKATVANFTYNELLDERLNEARLILQNSDVAHYPPLTEVKIEFYTDGVLQPNKTLYMVVGDDKTRDVIKPGA